MHPHLQAERSRQPRVGVANWAPHLLCRRREGGVRHVRIPQMHARALGGILAVDVDAALATFRMDTGKGLDDLAPAHFKYLPPQGKVECATLLNECESMADWPRQVLVNKIIYYMFFEQINKVYGVMLYSKSITD